MTSEERMKAFYSGEPYDIVPVLSFATMYAGRQKGLSSREFYFDPEKSYKAQRDIIDEGGFDDTPCFDLPHGEMLDFGGELNFADDDKELELPWVKKFPIESEDDAVKFELPPMEKRMFTKKRLEFQDYLQSKGIKGVGIGFGSPFTMVGYMADTGLLMRWMVKRPDLIARLINIAIQYLEETADVLIERYGVENCSASANVPFENNDLISVKMFEKYSLPSLVHMYESMRKKGVRSFGLHLCGNHTKTLPYFKELKLSDRSFISTDELNPIDLVADTLGHENIYAGNISCKSLVEAAPDYIYNESARIIRLMKYNEGGFVLMPSCDLPVNAKPENLSAMKAAAEKYGRYL